jgi:hypothetical protein
LPADLDDDRLAQLPHAPLEHGGDMVRAAFEVQPQHLAHLAAHDLLVGEPGELARAAAAADDAAGLVADEERGIGSRVVVVEQFEQEAEAAFAAAARLVAEALLAVRRTRALAAVRADEEVRHAVS